MKIFSKYAYMGAIALVGAVGFTACSSDDDLTAPQNPTFDGESVKTQFTINVPVKSSSTRLGDDIIQTDGLTDFRGMNKITMLAFDKDGDVVGTDNPTKVYGTMGSILNNELQKQTNAKVYYDIDIPVGTDHFIFYGEATRAEGASDIENGNLKATYPTSNAEALNTTKFELVGIAEQGNTTTEGTILAALNALTSVDDGNGTKWSASTELRNFYLNFIQLKAGSANSISEALNMLKDGLNDVTPTSETTLKTNILAKIDEALTSINGLTYPRDLHLPDGAVQLAWNSGESRFEYATSSNNLGELTTNAEIKDYAYPAALYYWTNSTIKVSDETESDNYATSWEECLKLYKNDVTAVEASTRSVALVKQINYAVARFDLAAWFNAATLKDNVNNDVDVTVSDGMKIVGLLVGGQKNVQYDFSTPVDAAEEQSIYDQSITSKKLSNSTDENIIARTLLLETEAGTIKQFAIELENNTGKSFVGHDGTVPAGGRFYLVGKLEPSTDPTYVDMHNKVFKQDYITTAKVTINSLAHAYNCIPDLKNPKLELGLSVDLEWQKGLVDEVTIE